MIGFRIDGLDELRNRLEGLRGKLASGTFWTGLFSPVMEEARRFAASISPVASGSYQAAHRVVMGANNATLSIDPRARNTRTGVLVTRYAASVEEAHKVYEQTHAYAQRLAVVGGSILKENLIR